MLLNKKKKRRRGQILGHCVYFYSCLSVMPLLAQNDEAVYNPASKNYAYAVRSVIL